MIDNPFKPGDMLVARRSMRAWESDNERGVNGDWLLAGDSCLVVQTWSEGKQIRLRVMFQGRLMLLSTSHHVAHLNWATDVTGYQTLPGLK